MFEYSSVNLPFPGEIRNRIYQHLLSSFPSTSSSDRHHNIRGILEVSRESRLETRLIYYSRTTWKFADAETAIRFFASLTPDLFPHICTLIVQGYPSAHGLERKLSSWIRKCWNLRNLQICVSKTFICSKLCLRENTYHWDANHLGLARLRGLRAFDICIHKDPSGPYKWKWRFAKLGLSLYFSKPPISGFHFTPLRVAIPPLITPSSSRLIQRQQQNLAKWHARRQDAAQRIQFYRARFGTSHIITRTRCKSLIYSRLIHIAD